LETKKVDCKRGPRDKKRHFVCERRYLRVEHAANC
jgi:hypothetical protein